jgi:hypothetical protein
MSRWIKITGEAAGDYANYFDGLNIEIDYTNDNVSLVTITDNDGKAIRVGKDGWNDMSVSVPAPPQIIKRYRLTGTLEPSIKIDEMFDTEPDANSRRRDLSDKYDDALALTIETVEEEKR